MADINEDGRADLCQVTAGTDNGNDRHAASRASRILAAQQRLTPSHIA